MTNSFDWGDLLKTADEAGFTLLPVGDYDVEVKTAEAVKSGSSGKDMIKVNFKVITGPNAGRGGIYNNFVLSPENPNAVGFFFRNMEALGLKREYFAQTPQPTLHQVASVLVGRRCRVTIGHREWNGQTQMDVKSIKPLPGAAPGTPPVGGPPLPSAAPMPASAPTPTPTPAPTPVGQPQAPQVPPAPVTEQKAPEPARETETFSDGSGTVSRPAPPPAPF